jgi:hypothetical protein
VVRKEISWVIDMAAFRTIRDETQKLPRCDADLETFVEGNCISCDPGMAELLPAV